MKFKVSIKDLSNSLKKIMPFVGSEKAFENILLEVDDNILTIKALNSSSNARVRLNVEADGVFSFAIKGSEFNNIINTFKEFINVELNDGYIVISEKKSKIKLNTLNSNCFPEKLTDVESELLDVPSLELINGIKNAIDFTDIKSMNVISGINIDFNENVLTVAATDVVKLSVTDFAIKSDIKQNITIPLHLAKELIKNEGDFKIGISDRFIKFEYEDFVIVSNLLGGNYPKVKQLIPVEYNNMIECKKSAIFDILKRIALLNTKKQEVISMNLSENRLEFSYTNSDNNSLNEVLDVKYGGNDLEIKCNYVYLQTVINNFDDIVKIDFDISKPLLFKNDNNTMLLMPCK